MWEQGSFSDPPAHGLETWFIRGGSAGAAIYTFRQPRGWTRTLPEPLRQEPLGDRTVCRAGTLTMLPAVPPIRHIMDEAPSIDPSLVRHAPASLLLSYDVVKRAPPKSDHSFARPRPEVKRCLAG